MPYFSLLRKKQAPKPTFSWCKPSKKVCFRATSYKQPNGIASNDRKYQPQILEKCRFYLTKILEKCNDEQ